MPSKEKNRKAERNENEGYPRIKQKHQIKIRRTTVWGDIR